METTSLQARGPAYLAQPRIPACVFEGMFVRGLSHEPLAQVLGQEGYDPRCPDVDYPVQIWKRCVTQARYMTYPAMSDADAYRLLGRKLLEGFAQTLLGRVAAAGLPMMGPARMLDRLPRYMAMMGRPELQVQSVSLGERMRRITFPDIHNPPELMAGAVEVALEHCHARPNVQVDDRSLQGYRLLVRW